MFKNTILILIILIFSFGITNGEYGVDQIGPPEAPTNSEANCSGEDSLCSSSYMIDTGELGLGGGGEINKGGSARETVDNALEIIANKLMIAFGVLALFIMTVGGGYMIFAGGQDDLLNKGKSIFTAGIIALVVALSAGIIMKIVISLLY